MNAAETIAALRADVEDMKAELRNLDPSEVGDLLERVARLEAAITTAAQWHGLETAK